MRTTITLESDAEALVRKSMRERRLSFKDAVNQAIVAGLTGPVDRPPYRMKTYDMGKPLVDLTKATNLAMEQDDEHTAQVLDPARGDER